MLCVCMYIYMIKPSMLLCLQGHASLDFYWKLCSCTGVQLGKAMVFVYMNINHTVPALTGQSLQVAFQSWTLCI